MLQMQDNFRQSVCHGVTLTAIGYLLLVRAMGATVKDAVGLYSMADDFTAAVRTLRRHGLYRTLEAIEEV
jgi:hypothetical protein